MMADIFVLISFCLGVVLSQLGQWGKWKGTHRKETWMAYWDGLGLPHLLFNAGIDASVYCLWTMGVLENLSTWVIGAIPFMPAVYLSHGDLLLCPQMGLVLGFGTDFFADPAAYALRHIRLPFLRKPLSVEEKT